MSSIKNLEYRDIVQPILQNEEFNEIKKIEHHGTSRYDHSLKVSYYSYIIARSLKLDYEVAARGGLLHDFFTSPEDRNTKERVVSFFNHPKKAVINAKETFALNDKEIDIIKSHMFPVNIILPKYAESWVVSLVDKAISSGEFLIKFRYKLAYVANLYMIFLLNAIR